MNSSRIVLSNFDPDTVIHPEDKAVISRLRRIPGFSLFLRNTVGRLQSSLAEVTYTGNGYQINQKNNPNIYNRFVEDCEILGLKDIPLLSVAWGYFISSRCAGAKKHHVIMTSGSVDLLSSDELDFLFGHELGHIICGHIPYHMLVETLYMSHSNGKMVNAVKLPLLGWYRISHYTADRVGLLCCQDINVALRTMIKMAGLPKECYEEIDIESFIKQAEDFEIQHAEMSDQIVKLFSIISANSPWLVLRAKKLLEWYNSDEYKNLLGQR